MTNEIRAKVLTITELATKINPTGALTDDKPEVTITFFGCTCGLDITIKYKRESWFYNVDLRYKYTIAYIPGGHQEIQTTKALDNVIEELQEIYEKYKETEDDGNEEA